MKKIIMSVLLVTSIQTLIYADSFKHNLVEFVSFASAHNNVNIIISDEVNSIDFYFFTQEKEPKISLDILREILLTKGLTLIKFDSFFVVDFLENNIKTLETIAFNEKNQIFTAFH